MASALFPSFLAIPFSEQIGISFYSHTAHIWSDRFPLFFLLFQIEVSFVSTPSSSFRF
jgi:hypothetical protein